MRKLPIILLCLIMVALAGCRHETNSHQQAKSQEGKDYIDQAAQAFVDGDADSAHLLLSRAMACYKEAGDKDGVATVWLNLGIMEGAEIHIEQELAYIDSGLACNASDSLHALLLGEKCAALTNKGDMRDGIRYGTLAIAIGKEKYDPESKVIACGNIAMAYRRLGMADSAIYYLNEGISLAKRIGDDEDLAFLYNQLSVFLCDQKRYDEAIATCKQASAAALRADNMVEHLSAISNEGITYFHKGDYAHADSLLTAIYPTVDSIGVVNIKMKTIAYLLQTKQKVGQEADLTHFLAEGKKLAASLPSTNLQVNGFLTAMTDVMLDRKDWQGALAVLDMVDSTAIDNGTFPREHLLRSKASCMAGLGRWHEAYSLFKAAKEVGDSMHGPEIQRQLSELQERFKVQEKELRINQLEQRESKNRLYTLGLASLLGAIVLLGLFWAYRRRQQEQIAQTKKYIEGMERERARFARELHDGACNELLGIGMQINNGQADRSTVSRQIVSLRETLRNISHELMPPQFDHTTLDDTLRHYLEHLSSPSLKVTFESEGNFSAIPKHIAYEFYRITQEAMGNIISHAQATEALVNLSHNGKSLCLMVTDNGQWEEPTAKSGDGIGLQSVGDRAKSIGAILTTKRDAERTVMQVEMRNS